MCGIIGYIGKNNNPQIGLSALKRLEYRGYDSAGMAVFNPEKQEIFCLKAKGKISELETKFSQTPLSGSPFILHTRWATHGEPSEINAHPHCDCQKNIYVVHNGIIENYKELKQELIAEGHQFASETDTEVIAHLIEKYFKNNLEEAVRQALKKVKGAYALAVIARKDSGKIIAAKFGSPLILGINDNEFLIASDASAIVSHTNQVITLDNNETAVLSPNNFFILKEKPIEKIEWDAAEAQKQGFSHFMLKEIFEEPEAIEKSIAGRMILDQGLAKLGGLEQVLDKLKKIEKIIITACGTASYAAKVGEFLNQEKQQIPWKR